MAFTTKQKALFSRLSKKTAELKYLEPDERSTALLSFGEDIWHGELAASFPDDDSSGEPLGTVKRLLGSSGSASSSSKLTSRQRKVHKLRAEGLSLPKIADELGVSLATVKRDAYSPVPEPSPERQRREEPVTEGDGREQDSDEDSFDKWGRKWGWLPYPPERSTAPLPRICYRWTVLDRKTLADLKRVWQSYQNEIGTRWLREHDPRLVLDTPKLSYGPIDEGAERRHAADWKEALRRWQSALISKGPRPVTACTQSDINPTCPPPDDEEIQDLVPVELDEKCQCDGGTVEVGIGSNRLIIGSKPAQTGSFIGSKPAHS